MTRLQELTASGRQYSLRAHRQRNNEPAICVSGPRCYMKRMKPPLHSGFVRRPPTTPKKRSPINQSGPGQLQLGHESPGNAGLAGFLHSTVKLVQGGVNSGKQSQVANIPLQGTHLECVETGYTQAQRIVAGRPKHSGVISVSHIGRRPSGQGVSTQGSPSTCPGGHVRGIQPLNHS